MTKLYDKDAILDGLRKNLAVNIYDFVKSVESLPEGEDRNELLKLKFSDIFNINSINSTDECLSEMTKYSDRIVKASVSEIQDILKCERAILIKTLKFLEMKGGMNGWETITTGERRGKKYTLRKIS